MAPADHLLQISFKVRNKPSIPFCPMPRMKKNLYCFRMIALLLQIADLMGVFWATDKRASKALGTYLSRSAGNTLMDSFSHSAISDGKVATQHYSRYYCGFRYAKCDSVGFLFVMLHIHLVVSSRSSHRLLPLRLIF